MPIEYRFGPYSPAIEEAYARLFPEDADEKSPDRLRWRFNQGVHGEGYFSTAHDTEAGNKIVGIIGLIGSRLNVRGEELAAYQAVDLIVDPDYRGRGVFTGLGNALLDGAKARSGRVVWGFPNPNAAHNWFGRFTWRRFGTAPFMVRPLRTGYFLRRFAAPLGRINLPLGSRRPRPVPGMREVERFGAETDRLWEDFRAQTGCAVDRRADWLNWRLLDRPRAPYRTVAVYDQAGAMRAFVSSCVMGKHDARICYVMEAISDSASKAVLARLIRHEIARAAAAGADLALSWCPLTAPNYRAYRKAGFLPFPEKLRPITIHFGAKLLDEVPLDVGDGAAWYISYVDSDTA